MALRQMVFASLLTALTAVMGFLPGIYLPFTPVPITLQNMGIMLAGCLLGRKWGGISMLVFVLLVAAGAPILSGMRGGMGHLLGPSGGYILIWPIMSFVIGWIALSGKPSLWRFFIACLVGGVIQYTAGIPWLAAWTDLNLQQALAQGFYPYIPGDLLKIALASIVALAVHRAIPHLRPSPTK